MKKNYVKPELEVVMFAPESMLANSVPIVSEEKPMGTNKHQGGWNQNQWTEN